MEHQICSWRILYAYQVNEVSSYTLIPLSSSNRKVQGLLLVCFNKVYIILFKVFLQPLWAYWVQVRFNVPVPVICTIYIVNPDSPWQNCHSDMLIVILFYLFMGRVEKLQKENLSRAVANIGLLEVIRYMGPIFFPQALDFVITYNANIFHIVN